MSRGRALVVLLIILLCQSLFQFSMQSPPMLSPVAYALPDMSPSDGDTWTENIDGTYTWTTLDPNDVIGPTTESSYIGSRSLMVRHTSNTTALDFRLDLHYERNFSSYDAISFWLYLQGRRSTGFSLSLSDFRGNSYRFKMSGFDNATWTRVVIPLNAFFVIRGSPSWAQVQYLEFRDLERIPSDNTTYFIDGLRFTDFETPIVSESESDVLLPNFYHSISKYAEKRTIYNNILYTSLYSYVDASTGIPTGYEDFESQSLGQALFALAIAYNQTKSIYLRTKLEAYVSWISNLRSTTQYKGVRKYFLNSTKSFSTAAETLPNGWILGGLSYMYGATGITKCKDIADDIRVMLVDQVWNETSQWFDQSIDTLTGQVAYTNSWANDRQGSVVFGLSAYYRFVSPNETVKDRVDKCLNAQLTKSFSAANDAFTTFRLEHDSFMHWGYYEAYKAFSNSTYWKYALAQAQINLASNMIYLNGSMGVRNNFAATNQDTQYGYLDEWGAANSLLLLLFIFQETKDGNILQSFKKTMFDYIADPQVRTSLWLVSRYRNARLSSELKFNTMTWQPTQAFIYASLVKYYREIYKPLRPYAILSTHEVKNIQFVPSWSSITEIDGDGLNATVDICVPYEASVEKPFPNDYWQYYINETTQWGSNWSSSNRILTVWAVYDGTYAIVLERENTPPNIWNVSASPEHPEYKDRVTVIANIMDERSGVRSAILSYNGSDTWINATMLPTGYLYNATIRTFQYGTTVSYRIYVSDNAANWNETRTFSYTVGDATPPTITFPPLIVRKYSSYSEVTIRTTINEPPIASGVENATLWYCVDFGEWLSQELLLRAGSASFQLQLQEGIKNVQYYAEAYDEAGNKATSEIYNYVPSEELLILGLPMIWFVGILIVVASLISICVYYFFRVRKRKHAQLQAKKP